MSHASKHRANTASCLQVESSAFLTEYAGYTIACVCVCSMCVCVTVWESADLAIATSLWLNLLLGTLKAISSTLRTVFYRSAL